MTAQRFAKQRFAFSPRTVLTEQAPVVLSVIARELGVFGVVFLAAGLVAIVARPDAAGILVAGAALGMLAMVVNLSGDLKGFITPIVVLLWPLVAVGADAVKRVVESPRVMRGAVAVVATVAMSAIPVRNVLANYSELDRSSQLEEGRFFRSLFAQLPDRAAIVAEDYFFDMALLYYEVTGEGGPGRGIGRIPFDPRVVREAARSGRRVFAFGRAATFFGAQGLSFERASVAGPSLGQWLRTLPRGTVIAGAAAYSAVPFEFSAIDRHQSAATMPRSHPFAVFALAAPGSPRVVREADEQLWLPVDRGTLATAAPPFPGPVSATADDRGARVEFGGRTIADVDKGLALAVFNADGTLWRTLEFPSGSLRCASSRKRRSTSSKPSRRASRSRPIAGPTSRRFCRQAAGWPPCRKLARSPLKASFRRHRSDRTLESTRCWRRGWPAVSAEPRMPMARSRSSPS